MSTSPITGSVTGWCIRLLDKNGVYVADISNQVQLPISFKWNNPGGCGDCSFTLTKSFEDSSGIDYEYGIEIWVNGECWYSGYVQDMTPKLGDLDSWTIQCGGYSNKLNNVSINKKYGAADTPTILDVGDVVRDLMSASVTLITGLTYDPSNIPKVGFEIDKVEFTRVPAIDAFNTLAGIAQTIYWGVGVDKKVFFKPRSDSVLHTFRVGKDITYSEETRSTTDLKNRLILRGGTLADGSTYVRIMNRGASQDIYGVREGVEDVSSISTDGVALAYGQWWLDNHAYPAVRGKLSLAFAEGKEKFIEPDGRYEVAVGDQTYTRSIGSVTYTIDTGCLKVDIETGNPRPKMGDIIKRILYQVQTGAQKQEQLSSAVYASTLADGKVVIYLQAEKPTAGTIGDYWIDTNDSNKAYQYNGNVYSVTSARQSVDTVVEVAGTDGTTDGMVIVYFTGAQPGSMAVGDIWVDTVGGKVYRWSGTDKVEITEQSKVTLIKSVASLTDTIPPPQPALGTASATVAIVDGSPEYRLTVNWTPILNPGDFRRYIVYYRKVGDSSWVEAASIPSVATGTYTIRKLNESTSYEFDVLSEDIYNNKSDFHVDHTAFQTSSDLPPANVTSLSGSFNAADVLLKWAAVTTNNDGSTATDIRRYVVTVKDGSTVLRTDLSYVPSYTYLMSYNLKDNNGSPKSSLTFEVVAEDFKGQYSGSPASITMTSQPPTAPDSAPTADPYWKQVLIGMAISPTSYVTSYILSHSLNGTNWSNIAEVSSSVYTHHTDTSVGHYYRYAYKDAFGRVTDWSPVTGPTSTGFAHVTEQDLASNFGMMEAKAVYGGVASSDDVQALFDGNEGTSYTMTSDGFIQYKFTVSQIVSAVKFLATSQVQYYVQVSSDGDNWSDIVGSASAKKTSATGNNITNIRYKDLDWESSKKRQVAKYIRFYFPAGTTLKEVKVVTWIGADELEAGVLNLAKGINIYNDSNQSGFALTSDKAMFYNSAIEIYTDQGPTAGTQAMWTSDGVTIKKDGAVQCVLGRYSEDASGNYIAPGTGGADIKWGFYLSGTENGYTSTISSSGVKVTNNATGEYSLLNSERMKFRKKLTNGTYKVIPYYSLILNGTAQVDTEVRFANTDMVNFDGDPKIQLSPCFMQTYASGTSSMQTVKIWADKLPGETDYRKGFIPRIQLALDQQNHIGFPGSLAQNKNPDDTFGHNDDDFYGTTEWTNTNCIAISANIRWGVSEGNWIYNPYLKLDYWVEQEGTGQRFGYAYVTTPINTSDDSWKYGDYTLNVTGLAAGSRYRVGYRIDVRDGIDGTLQCNSWTWTEPATTLSLSNAQLYWLAIETAV